MRRVNEHRDALEGGSTEQAHAPGRGPAEGRAFVGVVQDTPRALVRAGTGGVAVYAAACGAAGAVPLPFVDALLGRLARGAAMRRVASRRGVRLTHAARAELARPGLSEPLASTSARLVRTALTRFVPPMRVVARLEDGVATFLGALMFDHYLATTTRHRDAAIDGREAARVRDAMERAWTGAGLETLRDAPAGLVELLVRAGKAGAQSDRDGRTALERIADALLDGAADVPEGLLQRMCDHFDAALSGTSAAGR